MRRRPLVVDVAVLALLALYAIPFLWQLLSSFKPEAELLRVPPLWPSRLTLEHYGVVFAQSAMPRALANSFGVGLLTTALACALGVPAAYAMATRRVPALWQTSDVALTGRWLAADQFVPARPLGE